MTQPALHHAKWIISFLLPSASHPPPAYHLRKKKAEDSKLFQRIALNLSLAYPGSFLLFSLDNTYSREKQVCSFSAGLLNLVSLTFLHLYDSSHICGFGESLIL